MILSVIGSEGVVGSAYAFGFSKLGHKVLCHDIKINTKLEDILESEACFICVPTPQNQDGSCDISIVESVISNLCNLNYNGLITIKSTIVPGTTEKIMQKYNRNICFCPEFLRERCAISDVVENQKLLAIGTHNKEDYDLMIKAHGHYPKAIMQLTPTQAEMLKYMHNNFNAMRIIFANEFYALCKALNIEYTPVKNALLITENIPDIYLDVNDNMIGFAGFCLPKDLSALQALVRTMELDVKLFDYIAERNSKLKKTVFPGMRY